jgi:drug/metabolite transporter (DMT)-like permease
MVLVGSSVAVSQLLLDFPVLTGQAIRYAIAAAALLLIARFFPRFGAGSARRPRPREAAVLLGLAAIGLAGFNICVLTGLRHADPAVVGTFIGAAPLGLALLGPLQSRARPTPRLLAAAAIVVAGTAVVHGSGRADALGVAASAGALAAEVAFSMLAALVLPRLGAVRVSAYSCTLAVPLLLLGAAVTGEPAHWRSPTRPEWLALAYLATFMTVLAFLAWFTGLQRLGVDRAGVLVGVMPLATLATAAVMAGSWPAAGQVLGVLTVAAGLGLGLTAGRSPAPSPSRTTPAPSTVDELPR